MHLTKLILEIIVAAGILNVWVLRFGKATAWRGGTATNMREEFASYGLSVGIMSLVGFLKVICALLLVVGVWVPAVTIPAAGLIALLMTGAIAMHLKIGDPLKKSLPAATMLAFSLLVIFL